MTSRGRGGAGPDPYEILCVCIGSICRSPAAERLLAAGLGDQVRVGSAGTHALVGQPISPPMASLAVAAGASVDEFGARWLTEGMVPVAPISCWAWTALIVGRSSSSGRARCGRHSP